MNHVFRPMRFVGLRNEAAAPVEQVHDRAGNLRKGSDGETADEIWSCMTAHRSDAGLDERRRSRICLLSESYWAQKARAKDSR
jgi:hypothetical protein